VQLLCTYLQHNKHNMLLLEHIIGALAPHVCVGCGREGAVLCTDCAMALQPSPDRCYRCQGEGDSQLCKACQKSGPLNAVLAFTTYDGVAKQVIHSLKFGRAQAAAGSVAECIASRLEDLKCDLVLPVPTANRRVRQRGYDQAALIARRLARLKGWSYASPLRRLGTQRQLGQSRAIRRQQLAGAFAVRQQRVVQGKQVLIIDDVITTGSTLEAAARSLLEAGATQVSAVVFAIAPTPAAHAKK
jgi:ComF family protein